MEKPSTLLRVFLAFFISAVTIIATHGQVTIQGESGSYSTIQAAINAASPNAVILVDDGTYNESLTIDNPLTLQSSNGATGTIITGTGFHTTIIITASNVTIKGFTISNVNGYRAIYSNNNSDLTIENNLIKDINTPKGIDRNAYGIAVEATANAISTISIKNNTIENINGGNGLSVGGIAIGFAGGNHNVTGLIISENEIKAIDAITTAWPNGRGAYAILLNLGGGSGTGEIIDPIISNNTISDLEGFWATGIGLEGNTPGAQITGNNISNLRDHNNTTPYSSGVKIENNSGAESVTISGNSFSDMGNGTSNNGFGINNATIATVDASGNYWGSAGGPSGGGLKAPSNVLVCPYLSAPGGPLVECQVTVYQSDGTTEKGTYLTIQAAIDAAADNDVIVAGAGIFSETLTINKPLTLKGAQAGVDPRTTTGLRAIDGLTETIITSPRTTVLVNVTSSDVIIDGFQFTHTALAGSPKDMITSPATPLKSNLLLANNILVDAADEGIQIRGFENVVVEKNYILNAVGDAINLCDHPTATITSFIRDNQLSGSKSEHGAIFLYTIKNVEILRNKIESSNNGIRLARTEAATKVEKIVVKENEITGDFNDAATSTAGIRVQGPGTTNVQVVNNKIIAGASPREKFSCIQVYNEVSNIAIHENYLESGKVTLMRFAHDSDNSGGPTQEVNASCNWFGSADPSSVNLRIIGNGARKITPFLSEGTDTNIGAIGFTPSGNCIGTVKNITKNIFHSTIQTAIDAATDNDVIVVGAGTYNETITINKPLTLKGVQAGVDPRPVVGSTRNTDGTDETVIQGPGNSQLVNITSSNVTFDGFLVKHSTSTGSADLIGSPDAIKEGITIANNILLDATDEGIQIRKTNKALIEKNYVSGSKGDGINVCLNLGGEDQKILDNEIFNSRSDYGSIYLYDVEDVEVKGNYIHGLGQGINVAAADVNGNGGCKNIIIHHNDITSTFTLHPSAAYAIGISGKQTDGVTITNNNILNTNTTNTSSSYLKLIDINHTVKNITISDNYLDAKNRKYIRLFSAVAEKVNASCNWYGTTNYSTILSTLEGTAMLKAYPFLSDGTDSDGAAIGFTPLSGKCTGNVHNKTQNDYYLTIQEAVTSANTGDTLLVASGTYDEQVLVNKSVVIAKGVGETLPIIKYTGTVTGKPALFDVSVDKVIIDSLHFEVDLSKLKSAVIASGGSIDNFTFTNNEIQGKGSPVSGNYSDRNAVSVNHTGNTNYRVASGGVDNIVFSNNVVDGDDANLGFFRAALAVDEGAVTAEGNVLRTINHDLLIRFNSNNSIDIKNNVFNGGGVELAEQNGGSGKITVKDNEFNGAGAPNYALLRVKNNQKGIEHEISNNTFTDYKWAISLENMKNVKVDSNTFTTNDASANALVVNTKSLSSNSSDIVQTTIDATVVDNNFEGAGRGIVFVNHDNRAGTSFGTFTIGQAGKENKFGAELSNFIAFDGQIGNSSGSTFPSYATNIGSTTMACWPHNINAENNTFDVGSGLKLPATLNATEREALEDKLTHKADSSCLGTIQFFNPVKNLTQNKYYTKIQDAVADATAGDIIELSEWTFTEAVNINKPLTIQGVDSAKVILDGATVANGNGFTLAANVKDITIKNLTVKNFKGSGAVGSAVYGTRNNKLTIDKIIADNNQGRGGVYLSGPIDSVSITNSISKNHAVAGSRGIVIWNGLKSNISITNNYLASNNCCGIELQDGAATGVLIKGNTVYAEDSGISAVGLTSGSGNAKANIIDSNFVFVKERFGIEIKNPNGTGNDALTEDGAIIISRNKVTHQGAGTLTDVKDLAGIAVHRRDVSSLNVDVPTGVTVKNNEVSNFKQASTSTGFGIVIEGTNHMVTNNTLTNNDVGIQQQSGHLPYTANANDNGNQNNVDDLYFGRGNSPIICNITQTGNTFSANGVTERIVVGGAAGTIVTEVTPTVNAVASQSVCNGVTIAAVVFAGNNIPGTVYSWTNSEPSIGLAASGTGNIASFTATNTGADSLKAKIIVTPYLPNGCTGESIEFTIMVNPTPSKPAILPGKSDICEGGSVTLVAHCTVGSILWSTGQTTTSIAVSPTATTKYTAICKDALGCEGSVSDTATVIVLPRPLQPTLTASATTICNGNEVTLTASACTDGTLIWPAGVTADGNVATVKPTATQTYTVICQQTLMSCQSLPSEVVTITVTETTLTAPIALTNVIISSGASTLLKAECTTGTPKWYSVTGEALGHGLSYTTPALTVNTDYSVRCVSDVNNENDCKGPAVTQRVTIDKFEIVNQPEHIYVCLGQNAFMNIGVTGRSVAYQWQKYNGTSWDNISNGAVYTGVNTYSLQIAAPGTALNDSRFRCVVTNTAPDATAPTTINTTAAVLSVYESALANNLTMVSNLSAVTNIYQAVQTIKGTNKISNGSKIKYFAGNSITLEPGFEVSAGSVFTAKVQIPCTNTSSLKEIPEHIEK